MFFTFVTSSCSRMEASSMPILLVCSGLVELDHSGGLLDWSHPPPRICSTLNREANAYDAVDDLVPLDGLWVREERSANFLAVQLVGKDVDSRHPGIHSAIHLCT